MSLNPIDLNYSKLDNGLIKFTYSRLVLMQFGVTIHICLYSEL